MAYVISDACLSCGSCEGECPVGAQMPALLALSAREMASMRSMQTSVLSVVLARLLARLALFLRADRAIIS